MSQPAPRSEQTTPAPGGFGPNEWLVEELYQQYLADKDSVDRAWWDFFKDYRPADSPNGATVSTPTPAPAPTRADGPPVPDQVAQRPSTPPISAPAAPVRTPTQPPPTAPAPKPAPAAQQQQPPAKETPRATDRGISPL